MIYLKSILAGILTLILTALSLLIATFLYSRTRDFAIGWDPRGLRSISFWILVAMIFAIGYAWEYRRLSKRVSN